MQILNTIPTEIQTGEAIYLSWSIGCIIGIIGFIIMLIFMYFLLREFFIGSGDGIFSVLALLCLLGAILLGVTILYHPVMTPVNQYEVIMDDTVPFVEVIEKYDFVEQRGNIYVLQDKVPEK